MVDTSAPSGAAVSSQDVSAVAADAGWSASVSAAAALDETGTSSLPAPADAAAHAVRVETQKALRNGVKLAFSMASTLAVAFAVRFWLPRVLGPELFGQTHFSDTFAAGWLAFTQLGADTYISREVAIRKEHASEFFGSLLIARAIASLLVFAGIAIMLHAMGKDALEWQMVFIFAAANVLFVLNTSLGTLLQAVGKVNELAVSNVVTKVLWGVSVIGGVALGGGIRMVALGFLLSEGVRSVSLARAARRHVDLRIRLHLDGFQAILITCVPYFLHSVAHKVYASVNVTMISWLVNDQEVGFYGAAINVALIALLVMPVLQSVVVPMGARIGKASVEALNETMRATVRIALIFSVPMALLLALNSGTVVHILYKDGYAPAAHSLRVLGLLIPLTATLTIGAMHLIQLGRIWTLSKVSITAMVINPAVSIFLIPYGAKHWGLGGAGLAASICTVLSETAVAVMIVSSLGRAAVDRASVKLVATLAGVGLVVVGVHFALPPLGFGKIVIEGVVWSLLAMPLGALPLVPIAKKVAARVSRRARSR